MSLILYYLFYLLNDLINLFLAMQVDAQSRFLGAVKMYPLIANFCFELLLNVLSVKVSLSKLVSRGGLQRRIEFTRKMIKYCGILEKVALVSASDLRNRL